MRDDMSAMHLPAGLLSASEARAALDRCAPLLETLASLSPINGSGVLYLVVLDPAITPALASQPRTLVERAFGVPRDQWTADYASYARQKAFLSWRLGCDGNAVHALAPHLLLVGDLSVWGSVHLDGLVVGASGCEPAYDEAAAGAVAMFLRAQAKRRLAQQPRLQIEAPES